ncbi:MAG: hypothetical protein R3208_01785 [Ketobacteraceae bacterium]|nr:hypothetical protein [Ketobacteraceae bacterium]
MRNLFDQYEQPENKLTHAIVTALAQDSQLLRGFLKLMGCGKPPATRKLKVVEQSLVGELEVSEEEAERKGLPDAWIYDDEGWCLLIESKIASRLTSGQLSRHHRTAQRCGFEDITVLAIEATPTRIKASRWLITTTWEEIYVWLISRRAESAWARLVAEYFEVAERKFTDAGYLKEGSLTVFSGIPFDEDNPYSYLEAKRVLKLLLAEVRKDTRFCREAGIDHTLEGRGAITGKKSKAVWDYLRLKGASADAKHTQYPHFTIGINRDHVNVTVTLPNGMLGPLKRNFKDMGYQGFKGCIEGVLRSMAPLTVKDEGFTPWGAAVQRRYPGRSSDAIIDGQMGFDLRTAIPVKGSKVKLQEQWLEFVYDTYCQKNSNYQLQFGAIIPYARSTKVHDREVIDLIKGAWLSCRPLIDQVMG